MAKYKEILTVEQLLEFCEKQNFQHFSSTESGYRLAVKVPTTFEEVDNTDDNHRGMMKLKFRIFHIGLNRNGSFVSKESAKKAMKTIADRPVLAAIHQLDDGTWDFEGHEMRIIEDENGKTDTEYIESQVGSFSSEPAFWEHDDDLDKDYVCAYAYISEEYTKAAEIIRAKNGTKNSCELFIDELAYNAKEKYLELKEFFVNGSTLLGKRNDGTEIGEGMLGSRADIADFSVENNSVKYEQNDELIETLKRLNNTLDKFAINENQRKEETTKMQDNELEQFEDETKKILPDDDVVEEEEGATEPTPEETTPTTPTEPEDETQEEDDSDVEPQPEEDEEDDEEEDSAEEFSIKYSVQNGDNIKEFSVSMNEKIAALSTLVNDTYADDMTWYSVECYDDDKNVVMIDMWNGKAYRQSYKVKDDVFSLKGDRVEVFSVWMSADERKAFDNMKANYSSISEKLEKYESEPNKMEILESAKYGYVAETEEFTELKNNHFDLSVEEVTEKANEILLSYAEQGKLQFSDNNETKVGMKSLPTAKTRTNRYGTLFSK